MLTFHKRCNNDPRVAIKALIDSLNHPERLPWLKLDFSSFNTAYNNQCYACGATYTILNLLNQDKEIIPAIDPLSLKITITSLIAKVVTNQIYWNLNMR